MVALAIALGIYSYLILALGLLGWLYRLPVFGVSLPFLAGGAYWLWKNRQFCKLKWKDEIGKDPLVVFLIVIVVIQILINLLGALSPELSFDALWYHLTTAKIYVQNHQILYLPGWLLWPANVPRLADMFYVVSLLFSNEILAKLVHFTFGILSVVALFNLLKRYFNLRLSLLGVVTFYTMLIVGWQSTTAYVELVRVFFEILALSCFLQWVETKKENLLWEAGILVGLAMATKILAFGSLFAFLILIFVLRKKGWLKQILKFVGLAMLAVSPWLVFSFVHTGNPLFPLFGNFSQPDAPGINPSLNWILTDLFKLPLFPWLLWKATLVPDSVISPIYLIFLPLIFFAIWKQKTVIKITALYVLVGLSFAPAESTRYLLPYLPGFTLVVLSVFNWEWAKRKMVKNFLVAIIIFSAILNLGGRALATRKFLPYFLGKQSKSEFLSQRLNFAFGDFYDVDGFFAKNIKKDDLVLIYGVHNLYYVDFPYIHESWARHGTYFTHVLLGSNQSLPEKFGKRFLLYENPKTQVKLYIFGQKYQ